MLPPILTQSFTHAPRFPGGQCSAPLELRQHTAASDISMQLCTRSSAHAGVTSGQIDGRMSADAKIPKVGFILTPEALILNRVRQRTYPTFAVGVGRSGQHRRDENVPKARNVSASQNCRRKVRMNPGVTSTLNKRLNDLPAAAVCDSAHAYHSRTRGQGYWETPRREPRPLRRQALLRDWRLSRPCAPWRCGRLPCRRHIGRR
jgi:hypothetical protein